MYLCLTRLDFSLLILQEPEPVRVYMAHCTRSHKGYAVSFDVPCACAARHGRHVLSVDPGDTGAKGYFQK